LLAIPANKKIKLIVKNRDPTPEEFESYGYLFGVSEAAADGVSKAARFPL
jgi:hypothetical protein